MDICRQVGVVGLGLMGTAIAQRLLQADYEVVAWNRTPEKIGPLRELGAKWSDNPFRECSRVIVSLYNSDVVTEVLSQFEKAMRPGQLIIDTTTGAPGDAEAMARRCSEKKVSYLEAPVSGSSAQLRRGEATVIVGGDPTAYQGCADLWPVLGAKVFHVGGSGAASRMKLVTNLVLGLNRAALAEGLVFAETIGVDGEQALQILKQSAAYATVMDTKGDKMLQRDFTPQAKLSQHRKDLRLILNAAEEKQAKLSLAEVHDTLLETAEAAGLGELDNSAIIEAIRLRARCAT
jgi:3-hydroxyisobutyrate dehydrogenase-like beta-hydroxyacid dehydrogenase